MIVQFDGMFAIKGQGVVLSGSVEEGEIYIGQKVTLVSPHSNLDIRVKGLEFERKIVAKAIQDQRVAVMFDDSNFSEIEDGFKKVPDSFEYEVISLKAINCEKPWWKLW